MIQEALDHPLTVPSKEWPPNTDLRRAPLLDAYVEIAIAAGELRRAETAAEQLSRIAAAFKSAALHASALVARGRVRLAFDDAATACTFPIPACQPIGTSNRSATVSGATRNG